MEIYCRVSNSDQDRSRQERGFITQVRRADFEMGEVFKETQAGIAKAEGGRPVERKRVMDLAQRREKDAVLVNELTRCGGSTQDPTSMSREPASRDVSSMAQTGRRSDSATPHGELITNQTAPLVPLAESEHDLPRKRVRFGMAAAGVRGRTFGRGSGHRQPNKPARKVVELSEAGRSRREITSELRTSKNTVEETLKRRREVDQWAR